MFFLCDVLWAPKAGNLDEEYEDAFWPKQRVEGECRQEVSVAVADGATDSSFSGIWARQLVRAYCRRRLSETNLRGSLLRKQQAWARLVSRKSLPWYAQEKVRKGAFSTVLGLSLKDRNKAGGSGFWEAFAVGDSCLAQIRDETLLVSFPISAAAEFTNNPFLLGSTSAANIGIDSEVKRMTGDWQSGDKFYLMTDAIAAWFFREFENNQAPWRALRDLDTDELPFRPWLDELRNTHQMRNDDVTLYRIDID
jgi:Protein phosphatase 2C